MLCAGKCMEKQQHGFVGYHKPGSILDLSSSYSACVSEIVNFTGVDYYLHTKIKQAHNKNYSLLLHTVRIYPIHTDKIMLWYDFS